MRVNINNSVELDEIPDLTRKILAEATKNLEILFKEYQKINPALEEENEKKAVQLIDKCRKLMTRTDHSLGDAYNILMGYEQTLLQLQEKENLEGATNDKIESG